MPILCFKDGGCWCCCDGGNNGGCFLGDCDCFFERREFIPATAAAVAVIGLCVLLLL